MAKRLIVGNWKMNPSTLAEASKIARKTRRISGTLKQTEVVACPPFVFIPACISKRSPGILRVGAQTASPEEGGGPHTGEVGAEMLRDIGVEYVIVGHSEMRAKGDTDAVISRRIKAVTQAGLHAILCVGETTRDENGSYLDVLGAQIKGSLADLGEKSAKNIIIAYEPVWAIGGTEAMAPEQIREMSIFVKKVFAEVFGQEAAMKVKVLYGGSVHFRNAADIITIGQVDGLLVGRESVNLPGFSALLKAVDAIA